MHLLGILVVAFIMACMLAALIGQLRLCIFQAVYAGVTLALENHEQEKQVQESKEPEVRPA